MSSVALPAVAGKRETSASVFRLDDDGERLPAPMTHEQSEELLKAALRNKDDGLWLHLLDSGACVARRFALGAKEHLALQQAEARKVAQGQPARLSALELAVVLENEAAVLKMLEKGFAADYQQALVGAHGESGEGGARGRGAGAASASASAPMSASASGSLSISASTSASASVSPSSAVPSGVPRRPHKAPARGARLSPSAGATVRTGVSQPVESCQRGTASNPLHWACYRGHLAITCALLRYGFDPSCVDADGNTALHLAATGCNERTGQHLTIVELLLCDGASVTARNMFGNTAGQLATDKRAKALIRTAGASAETRAGLLSLHKMLATEEHLSRLLQGLAAESAAEDERAARGWDVFTDDEAAGAAAGATASGIETTAAASAPPQPDESAAGVLGRQAAESWRARSLALRTGRLRELQRTLETTVEALDAAVSGGRACYVAFAVVDRGARQLERLRLRAVFEATVIAALETDALAPRAETSLKELQQAIKQARGGTAVPSFALTRAQTVLAYLESRVRLAQQHVVCQARGEALSEEELARLRLALHAFLGTRIVFGAKRKRLAERLAARRARARPGVEDAAVDTKGKKGKKAKSKAPGEGGASAGGKAKAKRPGKDAKADREEQQRISDEAEEKEDEAALAANNNDAADELIEKDDDDVLVEAVELFIVRMDVEVGLLLCINEDHSASKAGTSARVLALENCLRRLEPLLRQCEPAPADPLAAPSFPVGSGAAAAAAAAAAEAAAAAARAVRPSAARLVNPDVLARALQRHKQLTRDLKNSKRIAAEKAAKMPRSARSKEDESSTSPTKKAAAKA